jgi:hypothetical protein
MKTTWVITACGCLTATTLVAEPRQVLFPNELDQVAAGACVVGAICIGTPLLPPPGLGPGIGPFLPGLPPGLRCPSGSECSSSSTIDVAGDGNLVPSTIPPGPIPPNDPQVPNN